MNIRKTFLNKVSTKTLYLVTLFALAAVAAAGFLLVPTNNTVSAQDNAPVGAQVSYEILSNALNFRTATEFAVLGNKGIVDNGYSKVGGDVGVGAGAQIRGLRGDNVKGMLRSGEGAEKVQKDFEGAFKFINYLPCTEVADTNLGGKTFTPGVYCLSSADLAGQVVLNTDDANGIFIFKVNGSLTTQSGSGMQLMNEAKAHNVFFIANDSVTVAENSNFAGTILARNNINVRSGSTVTGRTLSLNGSVELENSTVALQTGFLQICKTAAASPTGGLDGRLFTFTVGGQTFTAPVGGCTNRIEVASGPITITESLTNTNLAGTDPVTGRFVLTSVTEVGPGSLGAVNLQTRTASVNVAAGTLATQTVVTFNNQFAITGFVEICKEGDDLGVGGATTGNTTGIFSFQIRGVFTGNLGGTNGTTQTLATFTAPLGGCTGLIAVPVQIGNGPLGVPVTTTVDVMELVPAGTTFVGAFTIPADRLVAVNTSVATGTTTATNGAVLAPTGNGGTSLLGATSVRAIIVEGSGAAGSANQTTIFFRNQTGALLKICKVAGAGIPAGTQFLFNVQGTAAPVAPAGGLLTVGTGSGNGIPIGTTVGGVVGTGSGNGIPIGTTGVIAGATIGVNGAGATAGQVGSTQVVVTAGSCTFVSTSALSGNTASPGPNQQFQTGSTVTVTELGIFNGDTTGVINIDGVTGSVQVLQITNLNGTASSVNIGNTSTTGTTTNPTLAPRSIRFTLIAGTNEVEFVNIISNPALLKICKVAGAGVAIGETFTFNVTTVGPNGANVTTTTTVRAGPASTGDVAQNGFCDFATGPFSSTGTFGTGGFFNVGSTVSITEVLAANSGITTTITSPTTGTGGLTVSGTGGVTGTLSGTGGIIFGTGGAGSIATNEIVFTNTRTVTTASPTPTAPVPGASPTPTATPGGTPTATPLPPAPVPPLRPGQKGKARLMSSVM